MFSGWKYDVVTTPRRLSASGSASGVNGTSSKWAQA